MLWGILNLIILLRQCLNTNSNYLMGVDGKKRQRRCCPKTEQTAKVALRTHTLAVFIDVINTFSHS